MEEFTKIRRWLESFDGGHYAVDHTGTAPGSSSVCLLGTRQTKRCEDVTGSVTVTSQMKIAVYRVFADREDGADNARWPQRLQQWILQQELDGKTPELGDERRRQKIWSEDGKLVERLKNGTVRYGVTVYAQYVRRF